MVEEFLYAIKSKLGLGPKSEKWNTGLRNWT